MQQGGVKGENGKVPMGAMLLSCSFLKGDVPVSVGYNGQIVVLNGGIDKPIGTSDTTSTSKPLVITGHQAPISAMTFGTPGSNTIYTSDTDGIIVEWDGATGEAKGRVSNADEDDLDITGKVHA